MEAYRDLVPTEATLAEVLAPRGKRVGTSVIEHWTTLNEYLNLYARGLSPAGILILGGGPDAGSRLTGIPFTGPRMARERLGLSARGDSESPSEEAFWGAVERAWAAADKAPLESLFATVHLAQSRPFDFEPVPEVRDASARHTLRLLAEARPQATVVVGRDAVHVLARALGDPRVLDVAAIGEDDWIRTWPPGTSLLKFPYVEVPVARPFRMRLVPVPALDGPARKEGSEAIERLLRYAWAV